MQTEILSKTQIITLLSDAISKINAANKRRAFSAFIEFCKKCANYIPTAEREKIEPTGEEKDPITAPVVSQRMGLPNNIVSVNEIGGKIHVQSEYHHKLPSGAKMIGGKWINGAWVFDARDKVDVEDLYRTIYGVFDEEYYVSMDVEVEFDSDTVKIVDRKYGGVDAYAYGRKIATRKKRDYSVEFGDGVRIKEGGFPRSGGSRKNVSFDADTGTTLLVRDVPKYFANDNDAKEDLTDEN